MMAWFLCTQAYRVNARSSIICWSGFDLAARSLLLVDRRRLATRLEQRQQAFDALRHGLARLLMPLITRGEFEPMLLEAGVELDPDARRPPP